MDANENKFIEVREPHTDKLLFRFDPARDIIEVQQRGVKTIIDLSQLRPSIQGQTAVTPD